MLHTDPVSRRHFLGTTLAGTSALLLPAALRGAEADPYKGLKVGLQSYTLRNFSTDEAIAHSKNSAFTTGSRSPSTSR